MLSVKTGQVENFRSDDSEAASTACKVRKRRSCEKGLAEYLRVLVANWSFTVCRLTRDKADAQVKSGFPGRGGLWSRR